MDKPSQLISALSKRLRPHLSFVLLRCHRTWLEILLLGLLIAVAIAVWPTAQCALGACNQRDQWCAADCAKSCSGGTSLGVVTGCGTYNPIGGYCPESGWSPNSVKASCSNSGNCNVTSVSSYSSRLSQRNGRSYWSTGGCVYDPSSSGSCQLDPKENTGRVDCCSGSSGNGIPHPRPCTPTYAAPTVALGGHTPAYPLVYTQDPDKLGTTVSVVASGGSVSNGCGRGPRQATITGVTVDEVELAKASISWIQTYLAKRYPGARVKGSYPFVPDTSVVGLNTASAKLEFHYEPYDPGYYEVKVTATQSDGKSASATLSVPAFLLDSTITMPQP